MKRTEFEIDGKKALVLDDLFSVEEVVQAANELFVRPGWYYGRTTLGGPHEYPFWGRKYYTALVPKLVHHIIDRVREAAAQEVDGPWEEFDLARCDCNGHTAGETGYVHPDAPPEWNAVSILYYGNADWKLDWGGETRFFNATGEEVVQSVVPKPGRIAVFPSEALHASSPVPNSCKTLRATLSLLLVPKRDRGLSEWDPEVEIEIPKGLELLQPIGSGDKAQITALWQGVRVRRFKMKAFELEDVHSRILTVLRSNEGSMKVGVLADSCGLDPHTALEACDSLAKHGLARRKAAKETNES